MKPLPIAPVCLLLTLLAPLTDLAADETWKSSPSSGEWGDTSNWESGAIPGGSAIANFATSSVTDISISTAQGPTSYSVGFFAFGPGADAFTFTFESGIDFRINDGVANESGHDQKFYVEGSLTIASGTDFDTKTIFETRDDGTMSIQSGAAVSNIEVVNDANLDLKNGGSFSLGSLSGTGALIADDDTSLTVGSLDKDETYSGSLASDAGTTLSLTKTGSGAWTLSGDNSYTGGTTLTEGTLVIGSDTAAGTGDITITAGTLGYADGVTQSNNVILETDGSFTVSSGTATQAGVISESGGTYSLTKTGAGTLILDGENTYGGGTTISEGTLQIGDDGSVTGDITNDGKLAFDTSSTIVFSNIVSGSGSLVKEGTGIVVLVGDNTYSGGTTISGGTLYLGFETTSGSITGDVVNDGTLIFDRTDDIVFDGVLSGTGDVKKYGAGTVELMAASTFSGDTVIDKGAIKLGNALALQNSTVSLGVDNGLDLNGLDVTLGGLAGSGDLALGSQTLTVGGNGADTTYSGVLSGTGALTKEGAGTLTLSGTSTFTGDTIIDAGTLVVDGSIADSSLTTINDGGTLGGSGMVGDLLIADGGTLSPGNSPGTLSASDTTWDGGGSYVFEINNTTGTAGTNWDLLDITGTLDLTSPSAANPFLITILSLDADNATGDAQNFDATQSYSWILASASGGISGFSADTFAIDSSGFLNAPGSNLFSISSNGSDLMLVYTAVPEPGVYGIAIALGLGVLIAARKRRRAMKPRLVAMTAFLLAAAPLASRAALVTYGSTLTTIDVVGVNDPTVLAVGDQFFLTLTIDDSIADTDPSPDVDFYPGAIVSISLSALSTNAGYWDPSSLPTDPDGDAIVYNVTGSTAQRSFTYTVSQGPDYGTVTINAQSDSFLYTPGEGFAGTDTFTVQFTAVGTYTYQLQGSPYTVVPEPSTFAIAALALTSAAFHRIRRKA